MTNGRQPTYEQMQALRDYAAWAGSSWKSKLKMNWMRAGSDWPGDYALLQQLRNSFGPEWLAKVKL